jgi:hypothetical protein
MDARGVRRFLWGTGMWEGVTGRGGGPSVSRGGPGVPRRPPRPPPSRADRDALSLEIPTAVPAPASGTLGQRILAHLASGASGISSGRVRTPNSWLHTGAS